MVLETWEEDWLCYERRGSSLGSASRLAGCSQKGVHTGWPVSKLPLLLVSGSNSLSFVYKKRYICNDLKPGLLPGNRDRRVLPALRSMWGSREITRLVKTFQYYKNARAVISVSVAS